MKKLLGIILLAFITTVGFSGAVAAAIENPSANAQVIGSGNSFNVNTNVNRVDVRNRGLFGDDFRRFDRNDRFRDDFRRFDRDRFRNYNWGNFDGLKIIKIIKLPNKIIIIAKKHGKTIIIVKKINRHHKHHHR